MWKYGNVNLRCIFPDSWLWMRLFVTTESKWNELTNFANAHRFWLWKESAGVQHLKKLSDAGITHVHLLPTHQFGGVDDEKEKWKFVGKILFLLVVISHPKLCPTQLYSEK